MRVDFENATIRLSGQEMEGGQLIYGKYDFLILTSFSLSFSFS